MPTTEDPATLALKHTDIVDLRSALAFLKQYPGEFVSTNVEVDPHLELAGVYRQVGAGTPTTPPTKLGPAMLFENIKGHPGARVLAGLLAGRGRPALFIGSTPERVSMDLLAAREDPIATVTVPGAQAPCQEVVIRPPFDLRQVLPPVVSTKIDAGPYILMGVLRASDPETGESDVTMHRICIIGAETMTVLIAPGRHIGTFYEKAQAAGKPLPLSVNIGLDPAVHMATTFAPPTTTQGFDELTIAGGLRRRPVELVDCITQPGAQAIARAEIVLECELRPGEEVAEDILTGLGRAMPEFPGWVGFAHPHASVLHVTGITHRVDPIFQTLVGPGAEHVTLSGLPTEASIYRLVNDSMPGFLQNVHLHPSGGGKWLAVLQVKKRSPHDEGRQRQAAIQALAAFVELKHVLLVDEDVDCFDANDILWALTTRYQGDVDSLVLPGVLCHPIDPTARPEYNPMIREVGTTCKTIFDCTAPFSQKERFERAQFIDVDVQKFLPGGEVDR
jgi:UbiD family decarboxylase